MAFELPAFQKNIPIAIATDWDCLYFQGMSQNPIRLTVPTSRAWARMKNILFNPFDIGKWFVLGFTAWLATLFEGIGSGGSGGGDYSNTGSGNEEAQGVEGSGTEFKLEEVKGAIEETYRNTLDWIQEHPEIMMIIGGLVLFVVVLLIVLAWVSCRGKFMFLDNVVRNRALVSQPWSEFKRQGNSLFWWKFGFGLFTSLISLAFLVAAGWYTWGVLEAGQWLPGNIGTLVAIGGGFLFFAILMTYIGVLLEDFVMPVMYEHKLSTTGAWMKFLPLHNRRIFRFVLYAVWKFMLGIVVAVAIIAFAFGTCCIGLLLIIIPYIGAVVLLPVTVFFRSLGPEYLAQFGDEWDVFDHGPPPIA